MQNHSVNFYNNPDLRGSGGDGTDTQQSMFDMKTLSNDATPKHLIDNENRQMAIKIHPGF